MIIREVRENDRKDYLRMMDDFYHSDAVLAPLPGEIIERCFEDGVGGEPNLQIYIFEQDGETAGFANVATGYSTEAGGRCVMIEDLYILPEHRGMGLGTEFFDFIKERYPNARRFRLEAEEDNKKAMSLYRRMGFERLDYTQMVSDDSLEM